jgi:hypothetical protein
MHSSVEVAEYFKEDCKGKYRMNGFVGGGIDVLYPPTLIILVDLVHHFIYGTSITLILKYK